METVISLLVLSTLPHLVVPLVAFETSFRAVAELVSQDSRIFSGENARLKCSIPSNHRSSWHFRWFKGSEQLPQVGEHLVLWNTKVKDSGKFYCQGVRDTDVGDVLTLQSLPVEIIVYGGWAILQVPPHPSLVGHTLSVTCHVRRKPKLQEVVLYKNGYEVMRQIGPDPTFHLPDLTLQHEGMYSCRASWEAERRTLSVISAEAQVQVLEVLSQPFLEIVADNNLMTENKMKLVCHHQYNAPAPAPPIHFYFYEGDNQLGTATSNNHQQVKRTPGHYRCRAKVPELGLSQWSEFQTFGQVTGPKTMMPPILHPRDPWSLAPPNASPDSSLPPVAEPTTAQLTPQLSTTSTFSQPPDVSTQPSNPLLNLSQSAPSTLSSVQPIQPMASTEPVNVVYEESGEMSGGSGDMAEGSWDMAEGSGDMAEGSWGMPEGSGDMPQGSGDMAEGSGDMP